MGCPESDEEAIEETEETLETFVIGKDGDGLSAGPEPTADPAEGNRPPQTFHSSMPGAKEHNPLEDKVVVCDGCRVSRAQGLSFLRALDAEVEETVIAVPGKIDLTSGERFQWQRFLASSPALAERTLGRGVVGLFAEASGRPDGPHPHVFTALLRDDSWCTIRPYRTQTVVLPGVRLPDGWDFDH